MQPADIHALVQNAFNAGDADALVALYERDAVMATPEGDTVKGHDAIREQWAGFIAMGGTIRLDTQHAIEIGDVALLRNDWHFVGEGMEFSSRTAEIVRRQPDGTWLYVIDHPYGGAEATSE